MQYLRYKVEDEGDAIVDFRLNEFSTSAMLAALQEGIEDKSGDKAILIASALEIVSELESSNYTAANQSAQTLAGLIGDYISEIS